MIRLEPITKDNYHACLKLNVAADQVHFVANNTMSLAQAYVFPSLEPRAIFDDETVVGFLMYERPNEHPEYWIHRLMIGEAYQKRGYGRAAMVLIIQEITAQPDYQTLKISFEPSNDTAEKLYAALNFARTGEIIEDEVVMVYQG